MYRSVPVTDWWDVWATFRAGWRSGLESPVLEVGGLSPGQARPPASCPDREALRQLRPFPLPPGLAFVLDFCGNIFEAERSPDLPEGLCGSQGHPSWVPT